MSAYARDLRVLSIGAGLLVEAEVDDNGRTGYVKPYGLDQWQAAWDDDRGTWGVHSTTDEAIHSLIGDPR